MLKTCIKHPLAYISGIVFLLSGCGVFSIKPQPEVSTHATQAYQQALSSMRADKHKLAIKQFTAISQSNPSLSGPHTNLGILYLKTNSLKEAEQSLHKATELNSNNKIAYNYLGIIYRTLGQFEEAEKAYIKAIEIDGNYPYAHLNLGILYDLYKSDLHKALAHYQKYQNLVDTPDKMVNKWIIDLKRRDTAQNKPGEKKG